MLLVASCRLPVAGSTGNRQLATGNASVQKHLRPLEVEAEPEFPRACLGPGLPQLLAVLGVEQQEPIAAGADEFSAQRAAAAAQLVPLVDPWIAHLLGALLLVLPMLVH